jgi:hypothetical protein
MDGLISLEPLSWSALVFNLLLGIVLSTGIALYYTRFGEALSNRVKFARLLPVLCLVTVLVISVIKASLALSLGLVGALSIVRFRTAIKDPEELIYLFLIIAVGLGLGADQRVPTVIAVCVIMGLLVATRFATAHSKKQNLYLNIQVPEEGTDGAIESMNSLLAGHAESVDMRRLDRHNHTLQLTYLLDCGDTDRLVELTDDLRRSFPDCSFSFVDQDNMPA